MFARIMATACVALLCSVHAHGQQLQGGWVADARTGCKVWDTSAGADATVQWTGACTAGFASGPGVASWRSKGREGARFEGDMLEGKMHSKGVATWSDGRRYEGYWVRGLQEGQGTFTFANGDRYEGEFRGGELDGHGTLRFANGNRYEGEFRDGDMNGHGIILYANGDRYDGQFRDGEIDGRGKYVTAKGDTYDGDYRDGQPHGQGVARVSGVVFSGTWTKGCFRKGNQTMAWSTDIAECDFSAR